MASRSAGKKALKGCVVYYSATGSTGKVAGAIYRGMKTVMDCDIAPLKKISSKDMRRYDVIAIGGPIWYFRETANLRLFVYNMPRMAGKLCFMFCTHGAHPVSFFYSLHQPLKKKGFNIIGWKDWYGSCSHVLHMPKPYHTDGHPDDIDLVEAEEFGREMAERARRIHAGERDLIPGIPSGPEVELLWSKDYGEGVRDIGMAEEEKGPGDPDDIMEALNEIPHIDAAKCIYPRCTACMDNCVVDTVNLSTAAPIVQSSDSSVFIKGCVHCPQPMCQRACSYDAITYNQRRTIHVFDMEKCIYPKCTLCVDECPMDSIDFSQIPPIIHENCEGCDLCWCICPYGAISIPNIYETHARLGGGGRGSFFDALARAEANGRFRRLVHIDKVGYDNIIYKNPHAPRVVLNGEDYPYHINEW